MAYRVTTEATPGYLYVRMAGRLDDGQVTQLAKQVVGDFEREPRPALLVDLRGLRMNVGTLTTIRLVSSFPELAKGLRAPTAIVHGEANRAMVRFYETVAVNRGYLTRIFPDLDGAVAWLGG